MSIRSRRLRIGPSRLASVAASASAVSGTAVSLLSSLRVCQGFTAANSCDAGGHRRHRHHRTRQRRLASALRMVFAPPGSGYVRSDASDEEDPSASHPELTREDILQISPPAFPSTYEPMLEYPGTMRPGRTPENMPYHDLPGLGTEDPDPVPWPHFQEIEWHHRWDPPHEQALAMEEFIEAQGRWASVEEEAEMRMGMRRGVRERREMEGIGGVGGAAGGGEQMVIMDDEEEDGESEGIGVGLGDGVEALLKTAAETAKARADAGARDLEEEDEEEEQDSDDFLLDLGLGGGDEEEEEEEMLSSKLSETKNVKMEAQEEGDDDDVDMEDDLDLDYELGFDLDGDEDAGNEDEDGDFDEYDEEDGDDMSLDDYTKEDDDGDDDEFDDGGFDYGD